MPDNQQILEKAIAKAIDGGYKIEGDVNVPEIAKHFIEKGSFNVLIYGHNFAKALWGERETRPATAEELQDYRGTKSGGFYVVREGWQHHLQNMVIADDPVKYLGENI